MSEQASIAELMARDPLKLSEQDLDAIISDLRNKRVKFVATDDKKIGAPESRKSAAQVAREARAKVLKDVSLDDLFKDL